MPVRSLALATLLLPGSIAPGVFGTPPGGALVTQVSSAFLRFPDTSPTDGQPLRVLVALHGIDGDGAAFANDLAAAAD